MKKVPILVFAAVCFIAFAGINTNVSAANVSWGDVEKGLHSTWAKNYPKEKIIKIEKVGSPRDYEKVENGKKVAYCDYPAKVLAQQTSGKRVFNVTAIFRKTGGSFAYNGMSIGESTALAEKGQESPTKDEIKKLVSALYAKNNPGVKVTKVSLSDPELKKDSAKGRWWYNVGADVYITDKLGKSKKCVNDYTTVYKGVKGSEGVNASGPWQVYFLDDFVCK
jgi:hypothetical protein